MRTPTLIVIVNVTQISSLLFVVSVNSNNNKVALTLNSSSLENLSDVIHGAQIFQVRQAALDARERSVYRKTVLTRIEGKRQLPASLDWT